MVLSRIGPLALPTALAVLFAATTSLPAHVTLLAPNGGEQLPVGSVFTVEWVVDIAHDTTAWQLRYSVTGENGPWIDIDLDIPPGDPSVGSIHTYDWTVPDDMSDQVRVQIQQINSDSNDWTDESDENLGIVPVVLPESFRRGDCNADSGFDIADAVFVLNALFVPGGAAPDCEDACDVNDDGQLDISDAVYALNALFVPGSGDPPAPFPGCGEDASGDPLDCLGYGLCP